ncbi:hypothetical protein BWQ96_10059 [Gracilariopsis chorda]|uniref:Uncharacterized protein n=1 Tax=Gracilariopsis chorda TaxID=448386 RepID=A0A2V3IDU9_9FLOR|nr:hypothetical protein BWQ96_10059 [Gracilariopsis chorda]|eukprot:PXF40221.1 hypothetical protein BWQ96_10059 [Gracilariopsis chorda]
MEKQSNEYHGIIHTTESAGHKAIMTIARSRLLHATAMLGPIRNLLHKSFDNEERPVHKPLREQERVYEFARDAHGN